MSRRFFVDRQGSTITDEGNGLVWQLVDDGIKRTLPESDAYCRALSLAGRRDWRLPTIAEIRSMGAVWRFVFVEPKFDEPYWSSTLRENPDREVPDSLKRAAVVFFSQNDENQYWPHYKFYVRAVRVLGSYDDLDSVRPARPSKKSLLQLFRRQPLVKTVDGVEAVQEAIEAASTSMHQTAPGCVCGDGTSLLGWGSVIIRSTETAYSEILSGYKIGHDLTTVKNLRLNRGGVFPAEIFAHVYNEPAVNTDVLQFGFRGPQGLERIGFAGAEAFGRTLKSRGVSCWVCRWFD